MPLYTIEEFLNDKETLEQKQRELNRAQGRLDAVLRRLQDDFDCPTVGAAAKLLTKKKKLRDVLVKQHAKKLQEYDNSYGGKLNK